MFSKNHYFHLFLGMEYSKINNLQTALLCFETAKQLKKKDPAILNEIGCVHFKNKQYIQAQQILERALQLCPQNQANDLKASILSNLAQIYRKQGDYTKATMFFKNALSLEPYNNSVLFALGFNYHL